MAKLSVPSLTIGTLRPDYVDITWKPAPLLSGCNADPGDKVKYSVWFDGHKMADRESTHVDFDDLTPGSRHRIAVRAVPHAHWDCRASGFASIRFNTPKTTGAKLLTPQLTIGALQPDYVDIKWKPVPLLSGCNADPGDKVRYSVWFDGVQQADRESTHVDFDDLTPGSVHVIKVQAVPLADWDCKGSEVMSIRITTPKLTDPPEEAIGCKITGSSKIPLWYWDGNGIFPIPHSADASCPMKYGMGFGIAVSDGGEDASTTIATVHYDKMSFKKIKFVETLGDDAPEDLRGTYKGYVRVHGGKGWIKVTLTSYPGKKRRPRRVTRTRRPTRTTRGTRRRTIRYGIHRKALPRSYRRR